MKCRKFLKHVRSLATNIPTNVPIQAFISYAWPSPPTELQSRLLNLVEDLLAAGITVLLDIKQLQPGSDVKRFMVEKIQTSHTILWIGTPELKARIRFDAKGEPATNVAFEFCCFRDKDAAISQQLPPPLLWSIQSLIFSTKNISELFPDGHGLSSTIHDFSQDSNYFVAVPLLAASILGISGSASFKKDYARFQKNIKMWERSFTGEVAESRLQMEEKHATQQKLEAQHRIEALLSNMPQSYLQEQQDADDAHKQLLLSRLSSLKQQCLSPDTPYAQSLEHYIPLKGGLHADSDPVAHFEALSRVVSFLEDKARSTLLIFGAAGSGKSLFARFIAKSLWEQWNGPHEVIPVFISLPQFAHIIQASSNTQDTLFSVFLQSLRLDISDVSSLKSFRFLFILDGLDEVPLDGLPANNFLQHIGLSSWLTNNNKVVVLCRTQHIPIFEGRFGMSIEQYFQSSMPIVSPTCFHLMPFDGTQIAHFLLGYSQSRESRMYVDWTFEDYQRHINNSNNLVSLVKNPFLLKLVATILPQLVKSKKVAVIFYLVSSFALPPFLPLTSPVDILGAHHKL